MEVIVPDGSNVTITQVIYIVPIVGERFVLALGDDGSLWKCEIMNFQLPTCTWERMKGPFDKVVTIPTSGPNRNV